MRSIKYTYGNRISTLQASTPNIEAAVLDAEMVIGSALIAGEATPKLVTRELVSRMKKGAVVVVDVAIDQGGCFETSHPTTHDEPTFVVDGVVHYCVANMPGNVARTATFAPNNATLPHAFALADKGWQQAMRDDPHLRSGLNIENDEVTCEAVVKQLGTPTSHRNSGSVKLLQMFKVSPLWLCGRRSHHASHRPRSTEKRAPVARPRAQLPAAHSAFALRYGPLL